MNQAKITIIMKTMITIRIATIRNRITIKLANNHKVENNHKENNNHKMISNLDKQVVKPVNQLAPMEVELKDRKMVAEDRDHKVMAVHKKNKDLKVPR